MKTAAKLAWQYSRFYLRQTLSILFCTVLSMALLCGISSLIFSGQAGSREKARQIYGDWHYYAPADQELKEKIDASLSGKGYDLVKTGYLETKYMENEPYVISFVYGDEAYRDMAGYTLLEGSYPEQAGEIALDTYVLSNLQLDGTLGSQVTLGQNTYTLCGILESLPANNKEEMKVFVSSDTPSQSKESWVYLRFRENDRVYRQMMALSRALDLPTEHIKRNNGLVLYVGGEGAISLFHTIKTGLRLDSGRFTYILSTFLRENPGTNKTLVRMVLILFSVFIIYSIYKISLQKRISQYGVLHVLGIGQKRFYEMMLLELLGIFAVGYPVGVLSGNLAGRLLYSRFSRIFTGEEAARGDFLIDSGSAVGNFFVMGLLLAVVCAMLCRKMNKRNLMAMLRKNPVKKRSQKIYSQKTENMPQVLTGKFMFERKGTFIGILVSLSLGGTIFLGTAYMTENTRTNNALTMKADDGLASDMVLYEESNNLSQVIPEETVQAVNQVPGVASALPTSYLLGEIFVEKDKFRWKTFFPEVAAKYDPSVSKDINERTMELYGGAAVEDQEGNFRLKTNVYGYEDQMLAGLKDYLLEGAIDPEVMKKENTVILQTLMDGQGNYDGLDIQVGDTITLKVPKDQKVPEEIYKFQSGEEWYQEKEFVVGALVNRTMAKTDFYIGTTTGNLSVLFTNEQMKENFGTQGYQIVSIQTEPGADISLTENQVKQAAAGVPRCILKNFTRDIARENAYLNQKMLFYYGVALILLVISVLHIMNSISYLVLSRRHEFGILRAMGISDKGFLKMMLLEALRYGIYASMVMGAGYVLVRRFLLYMMQKVYLFVLPRDEVSLWLIVALAAGNVLLSMAAVALPAREILKDSIVEEIRR